MIDAIILTNTVDDDFYRMCKNTISTLKSCNDGIDFNIIVVETNSQSKYIFDCEHYIIMNEPFNYNKFLNVGLCYTTNEYHLILNNDLIFHHKSVENMLKVFNKCADIMSLSPTEPEYHKRFNFPSSGIVLGYSIPCELVGWCILMRKTVIDCIGKFDEKFKFWYQDNDYASSLKKNGLKHALCLDSHVTHLWSKSHDLILNISDMTTNQSTVYNEKWVKNS